jgi:hypothetical protein
VSHTRLRRVAHRLPKKHSEKTRACGSALAVCYRSLLPHSTAAATAQRPHRTADLPFPDSRDETRSRPLQRSRLPIPLYPAAELVEVLRPRLRCNIAECTGTQFVVQRNGDRSCICIVVVRRFPAQDCVVAVRAHPFVNPPRGQASGLPASTTRFAGTERVPVGSAVCTGVNESDALVRTSESLCDSEDVDSERPAPNCLSPR